MKNGSELTRGWAGRKVRHGAFVASFFPCLDIHVCIPAFSGTDV